MEFIPWSSYYEQWKDKKPLNEIIANYNMWKFQYEAQQHSLWLNNGETNIVVDQEDTNYLLMEDGNYLLLEDGGKIIL